MASNKPKLRKSDVARLMEMRAAGKTWPQIRAKFPLAENTLRRAVLGRGAYADFDSLADWPESADPWQQWCVKCSQFRELSDFYIHTSGCVLRRCRFCICADQRRKYRERAR